MTNAATAEYFREECRSAIGTIAAARRPEETVPGMLQRVVAETGLTLARISGYWHRKIKEPPAHEVAAIFSAAGRAARKAAAIEQLEWEIAAIERQYTVERAAFLASAPRSLAHLAPPAVAQTDIAAAAARARQER